MTQVEVPLVKEVKDDVTADGLWEFVRDALGKHTGLSEQLLTLQPSFDVNVKSRI